MLLYHNNFFLIINGCIRLQIEVPGIFTSVVGFTIVAVHRFHDDSVRHGFKISIKQCEQNITEQHIKYKDITSHSPQLRSKRQYNKALNTNIIPHIWELANIVPIPKPNKDIG